LKKAIKLLQIYRLLLQGLCWPAHEKRNEH
jgi:hypothetical protein